jgi:hypothetical protein
LLCASGLHTIDSVFMTDDPIIQAMLNYRLVATLLLLCTVVFPLATQWALEPDGSWFRPFVVWAMVVFASYIVQRGRKFDES